jgi:hypothetical protein
MFWVPSGFGSMFLKIINTHLPHYLVLLGSIYLTMPQVTDPTGKEQLKPDVSYERPYLG